MATNQRVVDLETRRTVFRILLREALSLVVRFGAQGMNIENPLLALNNAIREGQRLGVTKTRCFTNQELDQIWKNIVEEVGPAPYSEDVIRRSFRSLLRMKGLSFEDLKELE